MPTKPAKKAPKPAETAPETAKTAPKTVKIVFLRSHQQFSYFAGDEAELTAPQAAALISTEHARYV